MLEMKGGIALVAIAIFATHHFAAGSPVQEVKRIAIG